MSFEFAVSFDTHSVLTSPYCSVMKIDAGGCDIGFLAINHTVNENSLKTVVTPFTSEGVLDETCCAAHAVQALFAHHTGFNLKTISLAKTERATSPNPLVGPVVLAILETLIRDKTNK